MMVSRSNNNLLLKIATLVLLTTNSSTTTTLALRPSSSAASTLLGQARRLNNNNNDDGYDITWMADYSMKFHSCHTTLSFRPDGGNSGDGTEEPTELERLVLFQLCPNDSSSGKCASSCRKGGEYLVELREFVEAVYESKMSTQEYNCETVKDNCDCDNYDDDDVCLSACYATAGLDYCEDEEENDDDYEFDLQEYLECREVEGYNDDDDGSNAIYVGAYCAGTDIRLGVFSDRQCSQQISNSYYQSLTGYALPTDSLVDNTCITCEEPSEYDDDYNADQDDEDKVTEICEELYERSAKCEEKVSNLANPQSSGCNYMHNIMPQMEKITIRQARGGASASTVFMWLFLLTTCGASAVALSFYNKAKRAKVNLMEGGVFS